MAGLLGKDGSWLVLLTPALLEAGTHFSERSARFDDAPTEGWILAGEPQTVEGARATHDFSQVAAGLMAAFERAAQIARSHRPEDVTLLFYFSGHGDREKIHLATEPVPIRDIDAKPSGIPPGSGSSSPTRAVPRTSG